MTTEEELRHFVSINTVEEFKTYIKDSLNVIPQIEQKIKFIRETRERVRGCCFPEILNVLTMQKRLRIVQGLEDANLSKLTPEFVERYKAVCANPRFFLIQMEDIRANLLASIEFLRDVQDDLQGQQNHGGERENRDIILKQAPGEGTTNEAGGERKREKKAKAKIADLKEFDYWKPIYTKSKIEIHFTDLRTPIELIPEDFVRVLTGQEPKKWKWLMIILGGKKEEINTSQLQDVNDGLKKIFDTSIRFFSKNEPMPFQVKIERPKFDRRNAAYGENLEERNNALESPDSFIDNLDDERTD